MLCFLLVCPACERFLFVQWNERCCSKQHLGGVVPIVLNDECDNCRATESKNDMRFSRFSQKCGVFFFFPDEICGAEVSCPNPDKIPEGYTQLQAGGW